MDKKLKSSQLAQKNEKDLASLLIKERANLRDLYFRLTGAQLKNVNEIKGTKKRIAAILTTLNNLK